MRWREHRILKLGVSGLLTGALVVFILAYMLFGYRIDGISQFAYRGTLIPVQLPQ
jgi:hypothetical protein